MTFAAATQLWLAIIATLPAAHQVQFNRDVRPILAEHCWQCHGPDKQARQSELRLDVRTGAVSPAGSGSPAILPGDPQRSEVMRRITSDDESQQMPPVEFQRPLSAAQIELLKNWIAQGADYERHWAFQPISRPEVPRIEGRSHPIDAFVAARLDKQGKALAPEPPPAQLLRRVSLALTGLPPTLEELDTQETYTEAVERLLHSPHFGEHLAVAWLDAARYADTNGYFGDRPRQMWPWRDWVIDAFNTNMPFDQFTMEQIAGDLLPDATLRQRIATGFNRNHMANNETGIIDEEFRVEYVVDRVDTTLTTWMGLTVGCAQCHDHKYDPISQREFYQLFAFFNNVPEQGLISDENPPPLISVTTPDLDRQLSELQADTANAKAAFDQLRPQIDIELAAWEAKAADSLPLSPAQPLVVYESFDGRLSENTTHFGTDLAFEKGVHHRAARFDATQHVEHSARQFDVDVPWSIGFWTKPDGTLSCLLSKIEPQGARRGLEILLQKGRIGVNLVQRWGARAIEVSTQGSVAPRQWHHVVVCYDGSQSANGLRIVIDGIRRQLDVQRDSLSGSMVNAEPLRIGRRDSGLGYYGLLDELRILGRCLTDQEMTDWFRGERIRGIFARDAASRSSEDQDFLLDDFVDHRAAADVRSAYERMRQAAQAETVLRETVPTTLVMQEMSEPRLTHVLSRGQYDQPGEVVQPGVPAAISDMPSDAPPNRLGFAQWLVSAENPLTARVVVNRLWQHCFGEGLVRTMNDFGTQGEPPTHPELLDWLAAEFRESGWDVKGLLRLIVLSHTFRQESRFSADPGSDPDNRLLSRGPSYRMSAEMIRDQALTVSGLLRRQIGGPSVKPYQPSGLWEEVSYNGDTTYVPDTGDGLWRRSLYTYLKRQAPPPSFLAFDGVTREKCTIQRARTNTPLQALILLNDPTYVEASRALAARTLQSETDDSARLRRLFRRVLSRQAVEKELLLMQGLLQRQRQRFAATPDAASTLLAVGSATTDHNLDLGELAAWTVVAQTVLNLDEAINQR